MTIKRALFGNNAITAKYLSSANQPSPIVILDNNYQLHGSVCTSELHGDIIRSVPESHWINQLDEIVICSFSSFRPIAEGLVSKGVSQQAIKLYLPLVDEVISISEVTSFNQTVLVSSMHKSGSTWMLDVFAEATRTACFGARQVSTFEPTEYTISPAIMDMKHQTGGVTVDHYLPSSDNCSIINAFADKFILSVRDPRQAAIPMLFDHLTPIQSERPDIYLKLMGLPGDLYDMPVRERFHVLLDITYCQVIDWLMTWYRLMHEELTIPTTILDFSSWKAEPHAEARRIESFLELPTNRIQFASDPRSGSKTWKSGQRHEWQEYYEAEFGPKIELLTPDELLLAFNWQRHASV